MFPFGMRNVYTDSTETKAFQEMDQMVVGIFGKFVSMPLPACSIGY